MAATPNDRPTHHSQRSRFLILATPDIDPAVHCPAGWRDDAPSPPSIDRAGRERGRGSGAWSRAGTGRGEPPQRSGVMATVNPTRDLATTANCPAAGLNEHRGKATGEHQFAATPAGGDWRAVFLPRSGELAFAGAIRTLPVHGTGTSHRRTPVRRYVGGRGLAPCDDGPKHLRGYGCLSLNSGPAGGRRPDLSRPVG
jgi:hypothetical protein